MQITGKQQKNKHQMKGSLAAQFRWEMILGHLRRETGGAELLQFAQQAGIKMMFDVSLPAKVPALTFVRESRLPQNQEKGTVILLNPQATEAVLSRAILEKLHFCRLASLPTGSAAQTAARQSKLKSGNESAHKK